MYFEGIKNMPCRFFLNNEEIKLDGNQYTILTFESTGEQTIDLIFKNGQADVQTFVVDILPNSCYGFKLTKTKENKFFLMDLVNTGAKVEANTVSSSALSADANKLVLYHPTSIASIPKVERVKRNWFRWRNNRRQMEREVQPTVTAQHVEKQIPSKAMKTAPIKPAVVQKKVVGIQKDSLKVVKVIPQRTTERKPATTNTQVNLDTIPKVVSKEKVKKVDTVITKPVSNTIPKVEPVLRSELVQQVDCANKATEAEIAAFVEKIKSKQGEESRLIIAKRTALTGCISVVQLSVLVQNVETPYARYSLIKYFKGNVYDFENYTQLDALFTSEMYKSKLKRLAE
jgi:hypothetical protein